MNLEIFYDVPEQLPAELTTNEAVINMCSHDKDGILIRQVCRKGLSTTALQCQCVHVIIIQY